MKNFKELVDIIVEIWRKKELILEKGGKISKRRQGDIAEDYIVRKINTLSPKYEVIKSKGSTTPADIYSIARRVNYWHIMLIQVKSSIYKDKIYKLTENDIKELEELAKVVKETILTSDITLAYSDKPILISIGYAGVWRNTVNNKVQHGLEEAKPFKVYKLNGTQIDMIKAKENITKAHKL